MSRFWIEVYQCDDGTWRVVTSAGEKVRDLGSREEAMAAAKELLK